VLRSSALIYGSERDDPAFFTEETAGSRPRGELERSLVAAEGLWREFANQHPQSTVTVLRFAAAIGGEARGALPSLLGLPLVPSILGFDPRWQFIHEDDVLGVLGHAVERDLPGVYNAAADGVLPLSEVVSLLGKAPLPVLPPWGTVFAAVRLRRLGLPVPVELLRDLRYGRGLDNRRLKAAGYRYSFTSREAVLELRSHQRLRPLLGSGAGSYRYEREVEEFLRWSPSVQRLGPSAEALGDGELTAEELLVIIPSLEPDAIRALREQEASGRARADLLAALDRQIELRGS
jgi:UDP-glucose 4-epimerase